MAKMVVISDIVCLIVIKELGSVGVSTVIAALLVGNEVKLFVRCFGDVRDRLLGIGTAAKAQTDESPLLSIMKKDVYTLRNTSSIMDALQLMKEKRISGCPIVDDHDDLTGFISNGDIIRRLSSEHSIFIDSHSFEKIEFNEMLHDVMTNAVSEFATKKVITVNINDDLDEVCYILGENHLKK
ncbi:MAG: CBS domain-containing protein, partial [Bacillota bacterium]|nr:CBS domain-containing protein [Bacillota bacterium]